MTKSESLRTDFERATTRLEEALALPKNDIVRDSAIQRFEISFELCWKFLKAYLEEEHNASCTSPRTCFSCRVQERGHRGRSVPARSDRAADYTVHTYHEDLAD